MNERQKAIDNGVSGAGDKEHPPRTQKAPEIDGERADEHQGDVEGAADPCTFVVADAESSLQVWSAERDKAAREGNDTRAHDDSDDAEDRAAGKVRRHGARQSAGDLPFGWGMERCACGGHGMIGLLLCQHGGNDGETRTKFGGPLAVVEYDFDGDALNNFGEVAGGIIGRQ